MAAKHVLAVEHDELVRSFLADGLTTAGYTVDTAENGREALEKIDRRDYDAIISDLRMPELDGLALCRALRERRAAALSRFVLLSGSDALEDHQAYLDEAGVRALAKPVDLEDLRAVVERLVTPGRAAAAADRG
jgi:DNA-binding response OmpR family regulator